MANGYVVFEDAAAELNMTEDELKKLMDEGKLRHFMDGGKVKFRRKDLDELKATLGIAEETAEEEELTLAPPEDLPELPEEEVGEVPAPPPAAEAEEQAEVVEEEFGVAPLDEDGGPTVAEVAAGSIGAFAQEAPEAEGEVEGEVEEEIQSLSEFEIGAEVEEEGEELSEEEAQLLSIETPGFRAYEEPETASVGMTVLLVAAVVLVAFGVVTLLSFVMGYNPFPVLTDYFVK